MTEQKSNALRFINAYNQIDYALRVQYNFKRSMNFSDLIRRSVLVNHIVRKYEDDLIDYGRLRNAIIHRSNDNLVIAEPHDSVVTNIERIARLINTPPNALSSICKDDVVIVEHNVKIKKVIALMAEKSFSNIPIYKNGTLLGVANGQKILEWIGSKVNKNSNIEDSINKTDIEEVLNYNSIFKQYEVLPASATIEAVLDLFNKNRKLLAVIITKTGSTQEFPLGIITTTNIVEMNNILDNY